ncbi:MAG TPA: type II secretion system protein GspG, partial [Planctomycetota bacterium]|nr:type II secretion system protein GspG [Planctomycetota bacterium]
MSLPAMNNHLRNPAIRARGKRPDSGFTFFKVVVVVAVLGTLFGVAAGTLRGLTPRSGCGPLPCWAQPLHQLRLAIRTAWQWVGIGPRLIGRHSKPESDLKNILTVAETLYTANGRYPETIAEMVNAKDENGADAMASLEEIPKDPWGSEYLYEIVNGRPRVTCLGSDKLPGGSDGEAMDIVRPEQEGSLR